MNIEPGQRVRLPGEQRYVIVHGVVAQADGGTRLYLVDGDTLRPVTLDHAAIEKVEVLTEDGNADPLPSLPHCGRSG